MKIVVCVKHVAELDDAVELVDGGVSPDDLEWSLNEWDACALEAALQLREAAGEGEVVVLTVGDEEADESLRECLANGADRAVRVWDEALAGAEVLTVARVLAAAIEPEAADLVLTGVQSSDAANAATGSALAGYLELARVAVVREIEANADGLRVRRELEGGSIEVLRVKTPALLTVQTGAYEPRYATLRAIKQARDKPLDERDLGDLGLDGAAVQAAAGARVRGLHRPDTGQRAQMLDGDAAQIAARIAEIVKERVAR